MFKIIICMWLASLGFFLELAERSPTFSTPVVTADDDGDSEAEV